MNFGLLLIFSHCLAFGTKMSSFMKAMKRQDHGRNYKSGPFKIKKNHLFTRKLRRTHHNKMGRR